MYKAKTAKNGNLWMFWSITLLICHLFKSQQNVTTLFTSMERWANSLFSEFEKMVY